MIGFCGDVFGKVLQDTESEVKSRALEEYGEILSQPFTVDEPL